MHISLHIEKKLCFQLIIVYIMSFDCTESSNICINMSNDHILSTFGNKFVGKSEWTRRQTLPLSRCFLCYHMIMLSYMIMFIIFKAPSLPPCSNHLPFLFSILVYHPTLKMSPFLIAFVFQDVSSSIQFNVQLWGQFGNMWNLNSYEIVKEEKVPIY